MNPKEIERLKKETDKVWKYIARILDNKENNNFYFGFDMFLTLNARYLNGMVKLIKPVSREAAYKLIREEWLKLLDDKLI